MVAKAVRMALSKGAKNLGRTLELFPGSAHWSAAHATIGFLQTVEHFPFDPSKDMRDKEYVGGLKRDIQNGVYDAVHIATECTTFSVATGNTYRDAASPEGRVEAMLDPKKAEKITSANAYGDHSVDVFETSDDSNVLVILVLSWCL